MNHPTRSLAILLISLTAPSLAAQQTVHEIQWSDGKQSAGGNAGRVLPSETPDVGQSLRIEHPEDEPATLPLLTLQSPEVTEVNYALTGRVRYTNVAAGSYLEMWSHFSDGTSYFSRTSTDRGPMQNLDGSSGWREFALPFFGSPEAGPPVKLVLNLVLTGSGEVELSPLSIVQTQDARQLRTLIEPAGWWSSHSGMLLGAVGGTVFGLLGGLIGVLVTCGIARRFVQGLTTALFGAGCVALILGIVAVANRQPYHVYYPPLLLGVILSAVTGPMIFTVRRRYQQHELRRMASMDVVG